MQMENRDETTVKDEVIAEILEKRLSERINQGRLVLYLYPHCPQDQCGPTHIQPFIKVSTKQLTEIGGSNAICRRYFTSTVIKNKHLYT